MAMNVIPTGKFDVISLEAISADAMQQVMAYDNDAHKATDTPALIDGKPVYRLPRSVAFRQDGAVVQGVSIRVHTPCEIAALKPYALVNPVFRPFVRDGFVAWSITADTLVEVK